MRARDYCTIHYFEVNYSHLPEAPAAGQGRTLPDRITEHFLARIFTGELPAGARLPPDRELAPLLGVDRTSLRMAMQQLSRMGLVNAVRGSGVHVLDYREHAGIDFLAAVFALPGLSLGGSFLLQTLDDWIDVMPVIVGRAFARATHESFRELDALFEAQRSALDEGADLARLTDLEIAMQDRVVHLLGNTSLLLLGNSSRPLRSRLVRLFFESTDVREHVEAQRALLRQALSGAGVSAEQIASSYRAYLRERTQPMRRRLEALPLSPARDGEAAERRTRARTKRAAGTAARARTRTPARARPSRARA